jgi:hypothetical protein
MAGNEMLQILFTNAFSKDTDGMIVLYSDFQPFKPNPRVGTSKEHNTHAISLLKRRDTFRRIKLPSIKRLKNIKVKS